MSDLSPGEIRRKSDEFDRGVLGLDPDQVAGFLGTVADRIEELQDRNRELDRRVRDLRERLEDFEEREESLNEALLTAQEVREQSREQAEREASLTVREAEARAEAIEREAERGLDAARDKLDDLRARRAHFLRSFRALLEGYLAEVEVEQERLREAGDGLPPAEEIGEEADPEPPSVEPETYGTGEGTEDGAEPGSIDADALTAGPGDAPRAPDGEDEEER